MRRSDLIAQERTLAASYRREAAVRRKTSPALAARLEEWATASDRRAEEIQYGPLFREAPSSRGQEADAPAVEPKPAETEKQRETASA